MNCQQLELPNQFLDWKHNRLMISIPDNISTPNPAIEVNFQWENKTSLASFLV